jgi:hypothetical protein
MPSFFQYAWLIVHSRRSVVPTMPTTWLPLTSLLAAAAICEGCVISVWAKMWTGCPLTPPFALTQAKYAASMFGMSVKSVPGCLVLMEPRLIGVPVALTPGLGPHDEVSVDAGAALAVLLAVAELLAAAVLLALLLLELLLPHPARNTTPINAATAKLGRTRGHGWNILTFSPPRVMNPPQYGESR